MSDWKKLIVSGSNAELNSLNVGNVAIGQTASLSGIKLTVNGNTLLNNNYLCWTYDGASNNDYIISNDSPHGDSGNISGFYVFKSDSTLSKASGSGNSTLDAGSIWLNRSTDINYIAGNVGIGITTPTAPLHVKGTSVPSVNEELLKLEVSDSNAYFSINNSSTVNGEFVPQVIGRQSASSVLPATIYGGIIDSTQDSGTEPVSIFRSFLSSLAEVTTRPVFQFKNWSTNLMTILANGNVGIGTTTPNTKLDINGNTTITGSLIVSSSGATNGLRVGTNSLIISGSQIAIGKTISNRNNPTVDIVGDLIVSGSGAGDGIVSNHGIRVGNSISNPTNSQIAVQGYGNDYGGYFSAYAQTAGVGVYGYSSDDGSEAASGDTIGGKFEAAPPTSGFPYAIQLVDGTEGAGKVLVSQTATGKANWSTRLSGSYVITGSLKITGSGYINDLPILTSANTSSFLDGFGWYGVFCSTGSQTNPVANVSRSMQLDTTEHSNGVSFVSGSRITFAHAGVYNIQFSAQLESTSAGNKDVHIWFKKNGTNIARSNTLINVAKQSGDKIVAAWNYVDTANVNDYIEIMWQASDTTIQLLAATATGNIPSTPSVIVTATQVG